MPGPTTKGQSALWSLVRFGALVCTLLLVIAAPSVTKAQQHSGTITGTVTDPSGAPIEGASVTATNTGNNSSYSATTSEQGVYSFAQLPVGVYDIHVKQGSFKEFIAKAAEVHVQRFIGMRVLQLRNGQIDSRVRHVLEVERAPVQLDCLRIGGFQERAGQIFDQMVQVNGDSGSLRVLFGRAYRDADDMPAAIREFQKAIAIDPRTPHAQYFLSLAQFALNEWKSTPEIRAGFAKAVELYPRDYLAN